MTGYVHKAYPPVYSLLARQAGYDGAMIVRGVEGGCIPSLSQPAKFFHYGNGGTNGGGNATNGGDDRETRITPEQAGITCATRMIPIPPEMVRETPVAMSQRPVPPKPGWSRRWTLAGRRPIASSWGCRRWPGRAGRCATV